MRGLAAEFPMAALCRALSVARSSACYEPGRSELRDLYHLKVLIQTLLVSCRGYGVRRMYHELKRHRLLTTRTDVRRAYVELGLLKKRAPRRVRTTDSRHSELRFPNLVKDLAIGCPDHVWVADVTYIRIRERFSYLALLMDVFTRRIVGWGLSWFNDTALVRYALRTALGPGPSPEIHHSDQGGPYASREYTGLLQARGVAISMAAVGRAYENGYAERLNRTVKEEEVLLGEYQDIDEARTAMGAFIERYNEDRIHSGLGYRTPSEVLKEWSDEQQL